MKKILITGSNSFVGNFIQTYLGQWPNKYQVETVDMMDVGWQLKSFVEYDVVYHVAGLAHSDTGKISDNRKAFYYKINTDLAIETAKKSKIDGVKQFIFMSSAIVYGESAPIGKAKVITKDTPVSPANYYGDSKVQAERGIKLLEDENFKVVILRPPMIYGKSCKGNYPILARLAQKSLFFPYVKNERSMLYIGNLAEFVRLMIENNESGIFWPQNAEYSNTSDLVKMISEVHGKRLKLLRHITFTMKGLGYFTKLVNKAFGNLIYEHAMSQYKDDYQKYSLRDSIEHIENENAKTHTCC